MSIKRKVFVAYVNFFMRLFLKKKFRKTTHINCDILPLSGNHVDIITIAFNNEFLISEQIRLLKKYLKDRHYQHIIADNSDNKEARVKIQNVCQKEGVGYISLPVNYVHTFVRKPSYSHGAAMNWIYYNFIKFRKPAIFGFIDHDLFLLADYTVSEKIDCQDFYGHIKEMSEGWYLWAGFSFFKYDRIKDCKLNFIPYKLNNTYLDTGGSNYPVLYSKYDKHALFFSKPVIEKSIRQGNNYHADFIHYIDESWLHSINGSNWAKVEGKEHILEDLLNQY